MEKLLLEWADDFEAAARMMPTRLQAVVLMTRAKECREQAARAQGGQGAEPVALLRREIGESSWFDHTPVKPNTQEADALKSSPILDYCEVYTQPRPAVPDAVKALLDECENADNEGDYFSCTQRLLNALRELLPAPIPPARQEGE